jgi:hypothetical protein
MLWRKPAFVGPGPVVFLVLILDLKSNICHAYLRLRSMNRPAFLSGRYVRLAILKSSVTVVH